jgi:hypothetical protein
MDTLGIKKRRKKMKYYHQIKNKYTEMYMRDNFLEGNWNKNLVNWNILVAKKKEINKDFVSSGEWKWNRIFSGKKLLGIS